jgi:hypothetical protein
MWDIDSFLNTPPSDKLLLGVITLIGDYNCWCQDAYAVTADGSKTKPVSPDAVAWDILGAVAKLTRGGLVPRRVLAFFDYMVLEVTGDDRGVEWFNDAYDHGRVIDFLETAYRRLPDVLGP